MAVTYWITKRNWITAPCLILPFSLSTQILQVWNLSNSCYSSLFISCSHLIHTRDNEELQLHYPVCARDLLGLSIQMYLYNTQLSSLSPIFSSRQCIWLSTLDYNDTHTAYGKHFSSDMISFLTVVPFISRRDETTSLWNWKGQSKPAASLLHEVQQQIPSPAIWGDRQRREKGVILK